MNISTWLLAANIVFACIVIVFQISLLSECGLIRNRLPHDQFDTQESIRAALIGKKVTLSPSSSSVFISFSCATCQAILRQLSDFAEREREKLKFNIYIVDVYSLDDIRNHSFVSNSLRDLILPGKEIFDIIDIREVPIHVRVDGESKIAEISSITSLEGIVA